jgi:hypothetical protein
MGLAEKAGQAVASRTNMVNSLLFTLTVITTNILLNQSCRRSIMPAESEILVADECWVALAMLHREHPERESFSAREIMDRLRSENMQGQLRPGLQPHIHLHNVANKAPSSARYRMFYKLDDGSIRLFKAGDQAHPARKGKMCPKHKQLPKQYHELLDWYERQYCSQPEANRSSYQQDFVLGMQGVGEEIWVDQGGDQHVEGLRRNWGTEREPGSKLPAQEEPDDFLPRVWSRIVSHQGKEFQTKTNLPFTYEVEGHSGIWFYREGKRVNKRLRSGQLYEAIKRCKRRFPEKVTELGDLFDSAYLYGLLKDKRIRTSDW